jgi:hypothetical protein
MGQEHDDYADSESGPFRSLPQWLPALLLLLAAAAMFGLGIAAAAAFYLLRDQFAR